MSAKKVRVEKTLEVPVGEVIPLAKTNRSTVGTTETRETVTVGGEGTGSYSTTRATLSGKLPTTIGCVWRPVAVCLLVIIRLVW